MKTLIHNETKQSKFVWEDDAQVMIGEEMTFAPNLNIWGLHSTNATLVENITLPEDWYADKYLYDNGTWKLNPQWVDPTQVTQE